MLACHRRREDMGPAGRPIPPKTDAIVSMMIASVYFFMRIQNDALDGDLATEHGDEQLDAVEHVIVIDCF